MAADQKKGSKEGSTIVFIDESGFYLLPGLVRTYAPCGQTLILRVFHTRDHLSVMSAVTTSGQIYTKVRAVALCSADAVMFLKHLTRLLGRIIVIWDSGPIHRGEVRRYLADGGGQMVHLESLPGYAPDLNPVEGVWQHLKHVEMRNVCCTDLNDLRQGLNRAVKRLRSKPHIVKSFFAGAGLPI